VSNVTTMVQPFGRNYFFSSSVPMSAAAFVSVVIARSVSIRLTSAISRLSREYLSGFRGRACPRELFSCLLLSLACGLQSRARSMFLRLLKD